jgi:hypothetical protein
VGEGGFVEGGGFVGDLAVDPEFEVSGAGSGHEFGHVVDVEFEAEFVVVLFDGGGDGLGLGEEGVIEFGGEGAADGGVDGEAEETEYHDEGDGGTEEEA